MQKNAQVGADCNIGEHVFIEDGVVVGNGCTIKNGVAIWQQVTLEDYVFVGPYVVFTNDLRPRAFLKRGTDFYLPTRIKKGATLGANCTLVCGITIGEFAMVGAGAVVSRDVAPHALVAGNPARAIAKICFCGEKLDSKEYCGFCKISLVDNSIDRTREILEKYRAKTEGKPTRRQVS